MFQILRNFFSPYLTIILNYRTSGVVALEISEYQSIYFLTFSGFRRISITHRISWLLLTTLRNPRCPQNRYRGVLKKLSLLFFCRFIQNTQLWRKILLTMIQILSNHLKAGKLSFTTPTSCLHRHIIIYFFYTINFMRS